MKHILFALLFFCCSFLASSHGYVEFPDSRSYYCQQKINEHCGSVQYEPQSVEGLKGFPQHGPVDGKIASAGIAEFSPLDEQMLSRWEKVTLSSHNVKFRWKLTARHKTTKWEYFITKRDWNPNALLSRKQFELTPFCKFEGVEFPPATVEHNCKLPTNRQGYHIVLAVWTINDTANAFYQVIDVDLK